ncbi:MAG: hypothetical protein R2728_07555 [Chitinophagales bacterium]
MPSPINTATDKDGTSGIDPEFDETITVCSWIKKSNHLLVLYLPHLAMQKVVLKKN